MAGPYRIRPSVPDDLGALTLLEQAAFSDPWSSEMIAEAVAAPGAISLVAEDALPGLAGSVMARVIADEAEILTIAVEPSRRRSGLGRRLLVAVLEAVRTTGATSVWLEVRPSNLAARQMYQAAGFVAAGVRRGYYRRPKEDAVVLACRLDASPGADQP